MLRASDLGGVAEGGASKLGSVAEDGVVRDKALKLVGVGESEVF